MPRFREVCVSAVVLLISLAVAGQAGVPCPDLCTVEATGTGGVAPDAVVCPRGDADSVVVTVTALDCFGEPVPGMLVTVYPDPEATGFCFCPGEETKEDTTNLVGMITVVFKRFGGCGELGWHAEGRGVVLLPANSIYINSPDCFDNDCEVSLSDFIRFATSYQGTEPCCDYNRDGNVNLTDFIRFAEHYSHICE